jgi:hypothetical protein
MAGYHLQVTLLKTHNFWTVFYFVHFLRFVYLPSRGASRVPRPSQGGAPVAAPPVRPSWARRRRRAGEGAVPPGPPATRGCAVPPIHSCHAATHYSNLRGSSVTERINQPFRLSFCLRAAIQYYLKIINDKMLIANAW